MHILFITANTAFLDEKSEEQKLLKAMVAAAEVLHIVVFTKRRQAYKKRGLGERAWLYPTHSLSPLLYAFDAWRIIRLEVIWQRQFRAHIVHSDDSFLSGWLGLLLAQRYERVWMVNARVPYGAHGLSRTRLRRLFGVPLSVMARYALRICAFSERVRLSIAAHNAAAGEKVFKFQIPHDPEALYRAPISADLKERYPEFNFHILVAAELKTGVPIALALGTLALLRKIPGYGKAGLIVVGDGSRARLLIAESALRGLAQAVRLEKSKIDMSSWAKSANVLLYFASGEEEDEALITAAASGSPIVAIPSEISRSIIKNGENGIILGENTESAMAAAIRRLNEIPGLRERFKVNSGAYLNGTVVPTQKALVNRFKECWTYEEAPPELLHMEREPSFFPIETSNEKTLFEKLRGKIRDTI